MTNGLPVSVPVSSIANLQEVTVGINPVLPDNDANRMTITTGTAVFRLSPQDTHQSEISGTLGFEATNLSVTTTQFVKAIAVGAPARLRNANTANNATWQVNEVSVGHNEISGRIGLTADLFVRDTDGFLEGLAFQITTLWRL